MAAGLFHWVLPWDIHDGNDEIRGDFEALEDNFTSAKALNENLFFYSEYNENNVFFESFAFQANPVGGVQPPAVPIRCSGANPPHGQLRCCKGLLIGAHNSA